MHFYPRLIIAGMRGGSGKTSVSLATIAGIRALGMSVTPFKKGPDYIDAGWLSVAAGSPCYTLDPFLIPPDTIFQSFIQRHKRDIAVVEGNRGLHDGKDVQGTCSTAEVAKLLRCPVILVVDCTKMTRTAAALVLGCMKFDEAVQIKAVVINQVSGDRHAGIVRESIETYCGIPVVGAIPRFKAGQMPERHMGLTPHHEHDNVAQAIAQAGEIARNYLDISRILDIAQGTDELWVMGSESETDKGSDESRKISNGSKPRNDKIRGQSCQSFPEESSRITHHASLSSNHSSPPCLRIGVLKDAAFQFYYPENLEELVRLGAEVVEIDALQAAELPEIDALYIGGGFPETNAIRLAENTSFRASVKSAAEAGLPIYAECGGLMFLGESIEVDGKSHPMAGVFPLTFSMQKRPRAHGYSVAAVDAGNPFYPQGSRLQGHEFHYSLVSKVSEKSGITYAFAMERGEGIADGRDGICYKNVLATYTHIHALGTPLWAAGLIRKAREYHG